jgi:hypothetical protein
MEHCVTVTLATLQKAVAVMVLAINADATATRSFCHKIERIILSGPLLLYLNDNELPYKTFLMNGKFFIRFDKQ